MFGESKEAQKTAFDLYSLLCFDLLHWLGVRLYRLGVASCQVPRFKLITR